jgi:hypothetical protein
MIQRTLRAGRLIAAHCSGPVEERQASFPGRDRKRGKLHVTNIRRQQRDAKRGLEALFA